MVEEQVPAPHEIQQPAGCGDHQVHDIAAQPVELLLVIHAADERGDLQVGVSRQFLGICRDLHHEFPGGGDHQRPGFTDEALSLRRMTQLVIENGDEERRSLAGAGLGLADGVVSLQGMGQYTGLDRGAVAEAEIGDRVHKLVTQPQVMEPGLALLGLHLEIVRAPGGIRRRPAAARASSPAALAARARRLLRRFGRLPDFTAVASCKVTAQGVVPYLLKKTR